MFYPGVMDEIGEKLGGNFFVLPSSLHEIIVVPNDGNMEYKALLAMVTEINATEVDKQDKLTDQVYLNITVRQSRQSGVARATCPD
jgi:hypothetical protein